MTKYHVPASPSFTLRGAFRHPDRSEMSDVRSCKGGTVRTESKDLAPHHHFAFLISRETLIQSLSDFTLEFLYIARNSLTRIASYLRKAMTKLCIKILVKADSVIESAFP